MHLARQGFLKCTDLVRRLLLCSTLDHILICLAVLVKDLAALVEHLAKVDRALLDSGLQAWLRLIGSCKCYFAVKFSQAVW